MDYEFEQTSPTEWEVKQVVPSGTSVWKFDRCVRNYHKKLLPSIVSIEVYDAKGRIAMWWRRAEYYRGKPERTAYEHALNALIGRLS